jgi:cytochrome c peroxidase
VACVAVGGLYLHSWTVAATRAAESPDAQPEESNEGSDPMEPIQPIAALPHLDPRKVALGEKLFADPRLSGDNRVACITCHSLENGGVDGRVRSIGIHGAVGTMNAPSVLNCALNFRQFWDGRADTLESQIDGPVQSPIEMASTWSEVVERLRKSQDYLRAFGTIYRDGIESGHVKEAIAEFERSLTTPNSRFDRYLRHDPNAITSKEREGYRLFKSLGCASCHQGVGVGGNMYQKMGVVVPYFTEPAKTTAADRGRFNVTGDSRDLYMFKVPSLRNVALTAPYFHDGNAAALADAVRMMGLYQLGRPLTAGQVESIAAFLKTLTGELYGKPL